MEKDKEVKLQHTKSLRIESKNKKIIEEDDDEEELPVLAKSLSKESHTKE